MLPVVVIVGRPNVGKSTLFNALTATRDALVADQPGVTRDRQYGQGKIGDHSYILVDTGGIVPDADSVLEQLTNRQVEQALHEADVILFMVDARSGPTPMDLEITQRLRIYQQKIILVINKGEGLEPDLAAAEFHRMGFARWRVIAAAHKRGLESLMQNALKDFDATTEPEEPIEGIGIAIVGRPNVGKSTLVNRLLGEERVIVSDVPGTTRDSIYIPFERRGEHYTLIDTAGVRRRARVDEAVEKFSVIKTIQAIQKAEVVILVLNAQEGVTEQDMRLLDMVIEMGTALVLAINKWDGLSESDKEQVRQGIDRRLGFVEFARRYFISAQHGTGVGKLYHAIHEAYAAATKEISTSRLTRALEKAIATHQPPMVKGRRIKPRFAHLGGHHPLIIVIHGKQLDALADSYRRYLISFFRKTFDLVGVPIHLKLRNDSNPFKDEEED
ncbi:MAG TPA: ribosome biogenesis GTPase Der [Coxiellaceae bacterium]|nr:ribosome biogenesis GTPase Der [Coxiellaceae bacterium]